MSERAKRSAERNRKRGVSEGDIAEMRKRASDADRERMLRENRAGPRWGNTGDGSKQCVDRWGGENPPAA